MAQNVDNSHSFPWVLPRARAEAGQVIAHGLRGAAASRDATRGGQSPTDRLHHLVVARDEFHHALVDSSQVRGVGIATRPYKEGYVWANRGIELLIATGAIPNAREALARTELQLAEQHFDEAVTGYRSGDGEPDKVTREKTIDMLEHATGDAQEAMYQSRSLGTTWALRSEIADIKSNVEDGEPIGQGDVDDTHALFQKAQGEVAPEAD